MAWDHNRAGTDHRGRASTTAGSGLESWANGFTRNINILCIPIFYKISGSPTSLPPQSPGALPPYRPRRRRHPAARPPIRPAESPPPGPAPSARSRPSRCAARPPVPPADRPGSRHPAPRARQRLDAPEHRGTLPAVLQGHLLGAPLQAVGRHDLVDQPQSRHCCAGNRSALNSDDREQVQRSYSRGFYRIFL